MTIWISSALFTCLPLAVTAAATAYFFKKLQQLQLELEQREGNYASEMEVLRKELDDYRRRLGESEQRYAPVAESTEIPASLHLNRGGQVAQLFRRGGTPRSIASALGISQGEVKLIIKMHELEQTSPTTKSKGNLNRKSRQARDKASTGISEGEA
jgi:hypothetical protein